MGRLWEGHLRQEGAALAAWVPAWDWRNHRLHPPVAPGKAHYPSSSFKPPGQSSTRPQWVQQSMPTDEGPDLGGTLEPLNVRQADGALMQTVRRWSPL